MKGTPQALLKSSNNTAQNQSLNHYLDKSFEDHRNYIGIINRKEHGSKGINYFNMVDQMNNTSYRHISANHRQNPATNKMHEKTPAGGGTLSVSASGYPSNGY